MCPCFLLTVDTKINIGTEGLPYYTYDLVGSDWTATFVVMDSDCFLESYQKVLPTSCIYPSSFN